jgi:hypothetical protein
LIITISNSQESPINYNYTSIELTQSRIDKGLLAIPRSLRDFFPAENRKLQLFLDNSEIPELKPFTALISSTRESRIGSLKSWFERNSMKDGDEVIIQIIDLKNYIYRLIVEPLFLRHIRSLQEKFDSALTDIDASVSLQALASWTFTDINHVILNEFYRLSLKKEILNRRVIDVNSQKKRESVPLNLKIAFLELYQGHCQVCNFTFLKKDRNPYFEIHHIEPLNGNHPKNLLVVCANCHRQFEFAAIDLRYNTHGWLTEVKFNQIWFPVKQILVENELTFLKNVNFEKM